MNHGLDGQDPTGPDSEESDARRGQGQDPVEYGSGALDPGRVGGPGAHGLVGSEESDAGRGQGQDPVEYGSGALDPGRVGGPGAHGLVGSEQLGAGRGQGQDPVEYGSGALDPGRVRGQGPHGLTGSEQLGAGRGQAQGPVEYGSDELDPRRLRGQGPHGLTGSGESDLRRLLHDAVQEIEPRDGTLEHLRRAVPARRARKRQALVGLAAAALFIGTAVPALVHVSQTTGPGANPSVAGHGTEAQGGASQGVDPDAGKGSSGGASGETEDKGTEGAEQENAGNGDGSGTGPGDSAAPSVTNGTSAAICTAEQLAVTAASAEAPDEVNSVYGTFRFTNSSVEACTVTSPGSLSALGAGAADQTKITTARHMSGDPATALPDPSLELTSLLLQPGSSYEVRFAWVPLEACPSTGENSGGTGGGGGDPSADPSPTDGDTSTEGTSTGGDTGTSTQLLREDGTADGTVTVSNTAEPGAPTARVTVSGACAGAVYWTGVLAGA